MADRNEYHRGYQAKQRAEKREVPPPPEVEDKRKRKACDASLYKFGMTCFPKVFFTKPSPDHKRLADEIQAAIENGSKRAIAVQRGFGKTVWCIVAVMWATLTGRSRMAMLISGNQDEADNLRDDIVTFIENNDDLFAVYPEIPHFFRATALDGPQKKSTYQGELIALRRGPDVEFPYVPFVGSEACIRVRGIDSKGVRGAHTTNAAGDYVRPDMVLLDDPQDDDLAASSQQVEKRKKKIRKTIEGLGGGTTALTVLMACTPIEKGDLAEQFLDRDLMPDYQGIRWPALDAWPHCWEDVEDNPWTEYFRILDGDLAAGLDESLPNANKFYRKHKKKMSAGAQVRWKSRIEPPCVDALQSLLNKFHKDRGAFMSEMMMEPESDSIANDYLTDDEIATRYNRLERRQCPPGIEHVTIGVDVQQRILYWLAMGWDEDGRGFILDYDTFPKQPRPQFTHLNAPSTMDAFVRRKLGHALSWEESLQWCVKWMVDDVLRKPFRVDGNEVAPGVVLIDNRWEKSATPILQVAADPEYSDILQCAGGQFVGGAATPISQRRMGKGQRRPSRDVEWYFKRSGGSEQLLFDPNHYRSKFHEGLATEPGNPGSITYFGTHASRIMAEHLGAKYVMRRDANRRDFEEWKNKPGRNQDHWLDCAVMARVGLELLGFRRTGTKKRNVVKGKSGAQKKKLSADKIAAAKQRAAQKRYR